MTDFPFKTLADYDDIAVPMKPTFLLLAWRHGNRASINSSQAVTSMCYFFRAACQFSTTVKGA